MASFQSVSWCSNIPPCRCTASSLSISLLMDIYVVSTKRMLSTVLQRTPGCCGVAFRYVSYTERAVSLWELHAFSAWLAASCSGEAGRASGITGESGRSGPRRLHLCLFLQPVLLSPLGSRLLGLFCPVGTHCVTSPHHRDYLLLPTILTHHCVWQKNHHPSVLPGIILERSFWMVITVAPLVSAARAICHLCTQSCCHLEWRPSQSAPGPPPASLDRSFLILEHPIQAAIFFFKQNLKVY